MKPTDRHQYLRFSSAHTNHTKRSVVFSQTLRISRLCSNKIDFERNREKMRLWFLTKEYPKKLIYSKIRKVKFNIRETNSNNKSKNVVPFVTTYHYEKSLSSYGHIAWCLFVASLPSLPQHNRN